MQAGDVPLGDEGEIAQATFDALSAGYAHHVVVATR